MVQQVLADETIPSSKSASSLIVFESLCRIVSKIMVLFFAASLFLLLVYRICIIVVVTTIDRYIINGSLIVLNVSRDFCDPKIPRNLFEGESREKFIEPPSGRTKGYRVLGNNRCRLCCWLFRCRQRYEVGCHNEPVIVIQGGVIRLRRRGYQRVRR